jgi:chemotaxis protein methyltransferase CheR
MEVKEKTREFTFTDADFEFLRNIIYKEVGIVLAEHKRNMLYSRLSRRLRALKLQSFHQYCDYVNQNLAEELGELVNAVTTNLTSFFRESHHFDYLKDTVLPQITADDAREDKILRIWSAGCSAGAEPYSIAMVVAQFLEAHPAWRAKILATDIDTNMLRRGRAGVYRLEDMKTIPSAYHHYIDVEKKKGEERITMKDTIKKLITFNPLNLLDSAWPMSHPFDIIFCRNVVIYFDKPTQKTLFAHYEQHMKPQSWLFIGHSESLNNVSDSFESLGKTVYKRIAA